MKYIDVRVRMPVTKLGFFVDDLPTYARMIGYDRLAETAPKVHKKRLNSGDYQPQKGTAGDAVLKLLAKGPLLRSEVYDTLGKRRNPKSINSGFYKLVNKGLIVKQRDGRYATAK